MARVLKLACLLCLIYNGSAECHPGDLRGLLGFSGYLRNSVWPSGTNNSCCRWTGVVCSGSGRVTQLRLPGRGLHGTLSGSLADLEQLRVIDLSSNVLTGTIPAELSSLRRLEYLDLSFNSFSGMITSITGIAELRLANLSSNAFNGSLTDFGYIPTLIFLNISNNSIAGSAGPDLCIGSTKLRILDISANLLSGELTSDSLTNCSALKELYLGSNSLSEIIKDEIK